MTIIEVTVAALILSVGIIALITAFDASRRLGLSAEEHQTASAIAEQELHRIEALPWAQIALTAEPSQPSGVTSANPTYYEQSGTCAGSGPVSSPCYQWDWRGSKTEPLVISSSGDTKSDPYQVTTTISQSNTAVRLSFEVYRFITWANDPNCTLSTCGGSSANGDYKRILVAVTGSGLGSPVVLTTLYANPVSGQADPVEGGATCLDGTTTVSCIG